MSKKTTREVVEELERMLLVLPMIEAQRKVIKDAIDHLKHLDHWRD